MNKLKLVLAVFASLLILVIPTFIFAQDIEEEEMQKSQQENQGEIVEMDSFELFWPIVAGKTMSDPLYPLKTLKEKVRGLLIFGQAQKADYQVFLAVKRTVEAEKLLSEGKNDLAIKSLQRASSEIEKADKNFTIAMEKGIDFNSSVMKDRLVRLERFVPSLISKFDSASEPLNNLLEKVKNLNPKV